jgi:hypothetical protein
MPFIRFENIVFLGNLAYMYMGCYAGLIRG